MYQNFPQINFNFLISGFYNSLLKIRQNHLWTFLEFYQWNWKFFLSYIALKNVPISKINATSLINVVNITSFWLEYLLVEPFIMKSKPPISICSCELWPFFTIIHNQVRFSSFACSMMRVRTLSNNKSQTAKFKWSLGHCTFFKVKSQKI